MLYISVLSVKYEIWTLKPQKTLCSFFLNKPKKKNHGLNQSTLGGVLLETQGYLYYKYVGIGSNPKASCKGIQDVSGASYSNKF